MISDPDLVRYTCIAHNNHNHNHNNNQAIDSPDSTILAEFNSADSTLQELAQQCLHHTPPHHTFFSQTFRNQTYTFLLDRPFVYFGIFDPNMIKYDQMKLLDRLKDTLNHIIKGDPNLKFTSYCLQGELHPIFHKIMSKSSGFGALQLALPPNGGGEHSKKVVNNVTAVSKGRKMMGLAINKGVKKKRMMSSDSVTDSKEALVDGNNKVDVLDHLDDDIDVGEVKSRGIVCQNGVCLMDNHHHHGNVVGRQKAKEIWRRHVWIVLVLDLAVCLILFGVWLFVCRGFQCIER